MSFDSKDQKKEEMSEEDRKARGLMVNPDEIEPVPEGDHVKTEIRNPDDWDFGQGDDAKQPYASGEADRNRGSSNTGSTDKGGAMREGTQDDKVIKGD